MSRAALMLLLSLGPAPAAAQTLHLFGPPGDGVARRLVAVLETTDGRCLPAEDLALSSADPSVTVELGEALGPCARAIEVHTTDRQGSVTLVGQGGARATVGLGRDALLRLDVSRTGGELTVRAPELGEGERALGRAYWPGGETMLAFEGGRASATVPEGALVGVLVRVGERYGVGAVAPSAPTGAPSLLLMPLELAAGAMPRPAAVLVVADEGARLSRAVPLSVLSDTASLERLTWLQPGIAEVWLSAPSGTGEVDLGATAGAEPTTTRLLVSPGAPVTGSLAAIEVTSELVTAEVSGRTLDGAALSTSALAVRAGGASAPADLRGRISLSLPAGPTTLVLVADIDGAPVPIAWREVVVPSHAEGAEPASGEEVGAPTATGVLVRVVAGAAVDAWARPGALAGASASIRFDRHVALELGLRYLASFLSVPGQGVVAGSLEAVEHTTELAAVVRLAPLPPHLDFFAGPTLAAVFTDGALVGAMRTAERWTEVRGGAAVGVGTGFWAGPVWLGLDASARFYAPLHDVPFEAPWARVLVELSGGFDAR
jgi:hypothetical protein